MLRISRPQSRQIITHWLIRLTVNKQTHRRSLIAYLLPVPTLLGNTRLKYSQKKPGKSPFKQDGVSTDP